MLAQTAPKGKDEQRSSVERHVPDLHGQLDALQQWVEQSAQDGRAAHDVERGLLDQLLALGKTLFQGFLNLVGPGDVGESVRLDDGRLVHRSAHERLRRLLTVFGEFTVCRWVYAARDKAKAELIPTDQRLQLPSSEVSYLLQEWDQLLGIEHAFGKVREVMQTILRRASSVDTLEHTNQQMAEVAPLFRECQGPVDKSKEGALLVVTEDNKGIPLVRPVQEQPAGVHRTKGEKANKKQMACIGCVYSVEPHVRTPAALVATLFRDPDRPKEKPPVAQNKRYWAELSREQDGEQVRGQDLVFEQLQAEIDTRRRPEQLLVHLCDGQASLATDRQAYLPTDECTLDILDLMHVLPRLWEAAHVFHKEGSAAASQFVRERLLRVLEGQVGRVIGGLRQMGQRARLSAAARKRLGTLCAFLENNKHRMRYDVYLRLGCPIATGVIEGACRHVIKDRMERAGMRWQIPGAQAILNLRTIHGNGDWVEFQDFRITMETAWLYPNRAALEDQEWPASQAA